MLQQAVTLDPNNAQCDLALRSWSAYSTALVELIEGPLKEILTILPAPSSRPDGAARVLQAFYRGQEARFVKKSCLTCASRRQLLKSLKASAGLIVGEQHPLLLHVRPNWKGEITRIHFYDVQSNKNGLIVLNCPFRLPLKRFDPNCSYGLLMSCGCLDGDGEGEDHDGSGKLYLVTISFREIETGFYVMRQVYLKLDAADNLSISEDTVDVVHLGRRGHTPSIDSPVDDTVSIENSDVNVASSIADESDDISTSDKLYSLLGKYQARRGIHRYFGNIFLYNASVVTSGHSQHVAATPSAAAYAAANPTVDRFVRVRLLQLHDDRSLCFVLPKLLATLQNISDVLTVLLLGVCSMREKDTYSSVNEPIGDDIVFPLLSPSSDSVSIYDGKMLMLMREIGIDSSGAVVIAADDVPLERDEYSDSVDHTIDTYAKKDDAWLFLQDIVTEAMAYNVIAPEDLSTYSSLNTGRSSLQPRDIDEANDGEALANVEGADLVTCLDSGRVSASSSHAEEMADAIVEENAAVEEDPVVEEDGGVADQDTVFGGENVMVDDGEALAEDSSMCSDTGEGISLLSGSVGVEVGEAIPEEPSVHSVSKSDADGGEIVGNPSLLHDPDLLDVSEAAEDPAEHLNTTTLIEQQVVDADEVVGDTNETDLVLPSWLYNRGYFRFHGDRILYKASSFGRNALSSITMLRVSDDRYFRFIVSEHFATLQNISDVLTVLLLGVCSMREKNTYSSVNEPIGDDIVFPLLSPSSDSVSIYDGKMLMLMREIGIDSSGAVVIAAADVPVHILPTEDFLSCVYHVVELYIKKDEAWQFLLNKVDEIEAIEEKPYEHDPEKEKAYAAIKLSDEIEEEHLPFMYHAPEVDHNNITMLRMADMSDVSDDPYTTVGEMDTYRSSMAPPEGKQAAVNVQAAFFLAFQVQRLEALDYLVDRSMNAKHQVVRREAFGYLCGRARAAAANPVPRPRRVPEEVISSSPSPVISVEERSRTPQELVSPPKEEMPKEKEMDKEKDKALLVKSLPLKSSRPVARTESTRRGSVPHIPASGSAGRRRQSIALTPQHSREVVVENPLETKLQALLEEKLKDESFTENPGDLVDALQSFAQGTDKEEDLTEERDKSPITNVESEAQNDVARVDVPVIRRSSILAMLNPQKVQEWENKIATIGSIHRLNTTGKGRRNPVDFLESRSRLDDDDALLSISEPMFDESILNFLHMGYSSGTCAYLAIWKSKLRQCLRSFSSAAQLDKALHSLQRAYPEPLTRAGAFCALAETGGSIGEALGQLNDKTFKHELVLVCQALPVDEIIQRLADHMKKSKASNNDRTDGDGSDGRDTANVAEIMRPTTIMRSDSGPDFPGKSDMVLTPKPRAFADEVEFPSRASRTLPNFGMKSNSSTVLSRGTVIRRLKGSSEKSLSSSCFFPPITSAIPLSNGKSELSKSAPLNVPTLRDATATKHASASPLRAADTNRSKSKIRHSGTAPPKYNRMGKTIDNLAEDTDSLVVMSRLEAYRAQQESRLLEYHPIENSYYRSSRQKKMAKRKTNGGGGP